MLMRLMLFVCLLGPGLQSSFAEAPKPNVLFVICDDLNCDIGCYGHPLVQTPHLDQLAAGGVRFTNAHCQFSLCGPSRASFMTGLYPLQNGITRNAVRLRERFPKATTMSQAFKKKGYTTVRIGKIFHYNVPWDIGNAGHDDPASWTIAVNPRGRDKIYESSIFSLKPGSLAATLSWKADEGEDQEQTDGIAATEAVKLLDEFAQTKKPFFMAVGLYRPHTPFVAPKKYFDLYDKKDVKVPELPDGYLETIPAPSQKSVTAIKEQNNLDPDLAAQAIQAYYASISFVDAQVGRILAGLKRNGLDKNTIVVFTSDHGYHMGEHGHYQKVTLFENATHVPLIVSLPTGATPGLVTDAPAEMIDLYPTLTELAGVKSPGYLQGVSLQPALQDATARPRLDALSMLKSRKYNAWSLRTEKYRYTEWGDKGSFGKELYDRGADPDEMVNVAGQADLSELQEELATRLRNRAKQATQVPAGVKLQTGAKRTPTK